MIIAVASQKGGVGKTASSLALAACLGAGTLLVDLDPQGACAISLGIDADGLEHTVYNALMERAELASALLPTDFGFDLAASNIDLAQAELELAAMPGREHALRRALEPIQARYTTVLIDTPPTLGLLTMNAFAAADSVLIPVSTQLLSLRGLTTLLETIEKIRRYKINATMRIAGILPTKYDSRTTHAREVLAYLGAFGAEHGIPIFPPIRATVRFDDATNQHRPYPIAYPQDEATMAYRKVAESLVEQT